MCSIVRASSSRSVPRVHESAHVLDKFEFVGAGGVIRVRKRIALGETFLSGERIGDRVHEHKPSQVVVPEEQLSD